MRKLNNLNYGFAATMLTASLLLLGGCKNNKPSGDVIKPLADIEENVESDSTIYGTCGEGSAMSSLELITDAGDTLRFFYNESDDGRQPVQGGVLVGDRMAVVAGKTIDGDRYADKVINLTTLQGHWTSLDKNFEILEGGKVQSDVKAESNPWTSWKILNGQLLLNRDTFDINTLGDDSLAIESKDGIYVYKRL